MDLKDQQDYEKEDRRNLVLRLLRAQVWADFMGRAYDALLSFGVNFKNLPEYQDTDMLDHADELQPEQGQAVIVEWITRLKHSLEAMVRRKQLVLHKGGNYDGPTKH